MSSSNETNPDVQFEDLWKKLGECHQNVLQELEAKVAKLKKERCLDAQRLEVFYTRNQQLKEQNKSLHDAVSGLEERLRAGECERCAVLEDALKDGKEHTTFLIDKLKQQIKALEDTNKKLNTELEKLEKAGSDQPSCSSPEAEDGFIPDSPVMPSSLPATNKLKKRKNVEKSKLVRYTERPLPAAHTSLFIEAEKDPDALLNPVLVPNTCEFDASQMEGDVNSEDFIAETCRLDLPLPRRVKKENPAHQQHSLHSSFKSIVYTKPYNLAQEHLTSRGPDSTTDKSPSLLPRNKRASSDRAVDNNLLSKQKKGESRLEDEEEKQENKQEAETKASKTGQAKLKQSTLLDESQCNDDETLIERPNAASVSPVFKKPNATVNQQKEARNQTDAPREFKVEPMWSIDPALALEMYESEQEADEEKEDKCRPGELADSDCTWISHSLLQGRAENGQDIDYVSGLGEKANDSLDRLFDTSACEDYKSNTTLDVDDQDTSSGQEEEGPLSFYFQTGDCEGDAENSVNRRKPGQPAFAHVAVIRKKDDRRKLKGTTCKECEIYYAHLPEEERKKKLSNCSRHRFLYIPPCTPENFWEVGFPSTQTCIERGYIKEDKNPQSRSRRRQPFNALFSQNGKKQRK
ncbi:DNA endonuclease RBBP8 [Eucyclogobius newberryi]|uniref:DNA endonuclease RBBP8 n=1 Tax=Eucyclogobius newberryi TaxID=166745 RepID=UPI003B5C4267